MRRCKIFILNGIDDSYTNVARIDVALTNPHITIEDADHRFLLMLKSFVKYAEQENVLTTYKIANFVCRILNYCENSSQLITPLSGRHSADELSDLITRIPGIEYEPTYMIIFEPGRAIRLYGLHMLNRPEVSDDFPEDIVEAV